ncbi:MAG TPA: hypothetical protein VGW35_26810 [Methylomirabilota bacterium]|nr:hypothetical protein [Methylomirabilota bacterium]
MRRAPKRSGGTTPRRAAARGPGDRAAIVRRLRQLRRLARRLRQEATAPAVERVAQIIETECHLALWELGDVSGMIPDDHTH